MSSRPEPTKSFRIRREDVHDLERIRKVHGEAFPNGENEEARLVDLLREGGRLILSLVAERPDIGVVGHVAFSPVEIEPSGAPPSPRGVGLAPLAVLPRHQNQGIGTALVHRGLEEIADLGFTFVVVLGDRRYYHRFGFRPAKTNYGIGNEYGVDEEFQALELAENSLREMRNRIATYAPEFRTLGA